MQARLHLFCVVFKGGPGANGLLTHAIYLSYRRAPQNFHTLNLPKLDYETLQLLVKLNNSGRI